MSIQEQQKLKLKYYGEAMRYMDNAKECLKKANKKDGYYNDKKYVKMACGTAYSGLLLAMECFLILRGIHKPNSKKRKSIEFYQENIGSQDRKMLTTLNVAYQILHLDGYYDGVQIVKIIKIGFEEAYKLIEKIKPEDI